MKDYKRTTDNPPTFGRILLGIGLIVAFSVFVLVALNLYLRALSAIASMFLG